jgi:hypothetical protein
MEHKLQLDESAKFKVIERLILFATKFTDYFPDMTDDNTWIYNPFVTLIFLQDIFCTKEEEQ